MSQSSPLDHRSRIPLPDDVYLALIGQVAYAHAYLEWHLLGDLGRPEIERHLPDELKRSALSPKTAGRIVKSLRAHSEKIEDTDVRRFAEAGAHALDLVTETRNDLLHAHPATVEGEQMLYRYVDATKQTHKVMAITQPWLEAAVAMIDDSLDRLNRARIPFDQAP